MNINDKKQHICILYIYNIIILLKQVFRWGPTKIKTRKSSVLLQLSQVWGICLALRCLSSPASATLGVSLELSSVVGMQYAWFRGDPSERPVQRVWKTKIFYEAKVCAFPSPWNWTQWSINCSRGLWSMPFDHALLVLQLLHGSGIVEESGHKHHLWPSTSCTSCTWRMMKQRYPAVFSKPVMAAMA